MKFSKFLPLLFLPLYVSAQFGPASGSPVPALGDGKISAVLLDSVTNTPIEFATISVFSIKDLKKPIDGALSDDKGKFTLKNLAPGKITLKITSIGFKEKVVSNIEIKDNGKLVNLGNIMISADAKLLNEVVVTGQAAIIEEKVDRLVYNAEKDLSAKGGDAADVLRKVPLLTVDLDGGVQLRGSSNIRVLINNKPSTIMAASVADALKQIPADQIKTVEVITSPSSKYDAEGSTGIINIITKKNNLEGYSLNVDLAGGNRGGNLGLNGNLKVKKFGMTASGFGRANYNPAETYFEQRTKDTSEPIYKTIQNGKSNDVMTFGRYSLGADYDISSKKSLSGGVRFGPRIFNRDQELRIERFKGDSLLSNTLQQINSKNPGTSTDMNIDYLYVIGPQKELSFSTLYSRSNANSSFTNSPIGTEEAEKFKLSNINKNLNQELTFQGDYQTPIKKNQMFEIGAKGIFRVVNSDFNYLLGGKPLSDPKRPNGNLDYNQNIAASYMSYTFSSANKYTFKIGARYEFTDISATQSSNPINVPSYSNLVPSLNISKTYKGKYTVKAGYNRRLQRPGLQQLNPNVNFVNPQNIQVGNPELSPELTDNIEASLSASIKKVYINFSAFTRITANAISQVQYPSAIDKGVVTTSFQNIGQDKAYGINLFGNVSPTQKWMINGGIETFYNFINGNTIGLNGITVPVANEGWNVSGRLMSFISLQNGWKVQAFGFVRGGRVQALGRQGGFGVYSLGLRKDFKNKKGSIGLSTQNFLTKSINMISFAETPQFYQYNKNTMFNRGISLNLSYKIGKLGADALQSQKKKAKGVKNDDIKDGEGGGGGQTQGGPPAGRN